MRYQVMYIVLLEMVFCNEIRKLSSAEYLMTAFKSEEKLEKFAVAVHVLRKRRIWSFDVVVLQRTAKKCTKIITHVQSYCIAY